MSTDDFVAVYSGNIVQVDLLKSILEGSGIQWLKAQGRGYQTRINRILRAAMESQRPRRSRPAPKKTTRSRSGLKPA